MEPVKHFEWALTILFFTFGIIDQQITPMAIFWIGIGSQLADILEFILKRGCFISSSIARYFSHSFLLPLVLLGVYWNIFTTQPFIFYLGFSSGIHLIVDSYGGGEGIMLLYPLNTNYRLSAITKKTRKKLGGMIRKNLGHLIEGETNNDLAWFWLLQMISVTLLSFSIVFYFF